MSPAWRAYVVGLLSGLFAWLCILTWVATLVCLAGSLFFNWRWRWLVWSVVCSFLFEWLQIGFEANLHRMNNEGLVRRMEARDATE